MTNREQNVIPFQRRKVFVSAIAGRGAIQKNGRKPEGSGQWI